MHARYLVLALALVVVAPTRGGMQASPTADGTSVGPTVRITFRGKVIDAHRALVPGARATLYRMTLRQMREDPESEVLGEETTGADGTFLFSSVGEANFRRVGYVIVRKEGFALGWAVWEMREDEQATVRLSELKDLAGVVLDEQGQSIPEAEVGIARAVMTGVEGPRTLGIPVFLRTQTDRAGHFVFPNMPAEATFELSARKTGRASIRTVNRSGPFFQDQGQFAPGQLGIQLILLPEARIEGRVVEKAGGRPVGGVRIMAMSDAMWNAGFPPSSATTADDGTFRLGGLAAGRCLVSLWPAPGEQPAQQVVEPVVVNLSAGETMGKVELQLTPGSLIEVFVRDAAGKAVEKATVRVFRLAPEEAFTGTTDVHGIARVRVTPSVYDILEPSTDGLIRPASKERVSIKEGEVKRIECLVHPFTKITGTVRDAAGQPLAGVKIELRPGDSRIATDGEGKFAVDWDSGSYGRTRGTYLYLVAMDAARNLGAIADVREQTTGLELQLQPRVTITGRVLNQEGKPLQGALIGVTTLRASTSWTPCLGRRERITTGEDGAFEAQAVPAERQYLVSARADGYGECEVDIEASRIKDHRWDVGPLRLAVANLSISGTVVDPGGKPLADVTVFASGAGQRARRMAQTDAEGRFTIRGLCAGPVVVSVMTEELTPRVHTQAGATDVKLVFSCRR